MQVPIPEGMDRRGLTDRLLRITEAAPFTSFRIKQGCIHAAEVVGCIQLGNVRINILPKLDTAEENRDSDFLLNILRSAGYLSRAYASSANVRASSCDPLEAMIAEVATEMTNAIREGIPRRYQERCEDSSTLRGRIDFAKLSTRLPAGQVDLPIRYSPLSTDNLLAQCVKWISSALLRLTRSSMNRQALAAIVGQLGNVKRQSISSAQLESLRLSRFETQWAKSIAIGRLLLEGRFADPTFSGQSDAFSMLFPLQHLFERAMRKILADATYGTGVTVSYRTEPLFLLQGQDMQEGVVRLKPDYVFRGEAGLIAVADAKWKRVTELGRAHGVGREDLYQINAYLTRYKAKNSIIFVPRANWMSSEWTVRYTVAETESHVHLVGVDIESLVSHRHGIRQTALAALSGVLRGITSG